MVEYHPISAKDLSRPHQFKTSWQMGKHSVKGDLENHSAAWNWWRLRRRWLGKIRTRCWRHLGGDDGALWHRIPCVFGCRAPSTWLGDDVSNHVALFTEAADPYEELTNAIGLRLGTHGILQKSNAFSGLCQSVSETSETLLTCHATSSV